MKISELQNLLDTMKARHGDIETTMIATFLPESKEVFADVFESTIEGARIRDDKWHGHTKRLVLHWQT